MANSDFISLFFWSSVRYERKPAENYGDLLSPYIVEKLSGREAIFYDAPNRKKFWQRKKYLMAIGSIMSHTQPRAVVWGSGIISKEDRFSTANFRAVRGPLSRKRILELGYDCPEIYGDPALLLPTIFNPDVAKKYVYGVIPHYVDYTQAEAQFGNEEDIIIINLINNDHEAVTRQILSCERIVSSSLHGVIVAQAYGIPAVWVQFSDKLSGDNVKFDDYFESVGVATYIGPYIEEGSTTAVFSEFFNTHVHTADPILLAKCQQDLIDAFPFPKL
ncbi:MAG: hypothetical protein ACJARZ_002922 [Dokdonia sp.]|jgi:hypothetical protein